jgi:hypothetical protein
MRSDILQLIVESQKNSKLLNFPKALLPRFESMTDYILSDRIRYIGFVRLLTLAHYHSPHGRVFDGWLPNELDVSLSIIANESSPYGCMRRCKVHYVGTPSLVAMQRL